MELHPKFLRKIALLTINRPNNPLWAKRYSCLPVLMGFPSSHLCTEMERVFKVKNNRHQSLSVAVDRFLKR